MYGFLYVADKFEGLVIVGNPDLKAKTPGVATLLDGDPKNNFLKRALAFNPDGALTRRAPHCFRRNLRLHSLRSRAGGGGPRQSARAEDHGANRYSGPG